MAEVRVAIVGVGNCASSLIQGVEHYRNASEDDGVPGLMHVTMGAYHVNDIKFVAAFDVDSNKVGKDLAEAILEPPNNTKKFATVPPLGVKVHRGPTMDGLGKYYRETIAESTAPEVDVAKKLTESGADVLINYLPVGSEDATRYYIDEALKAGCGVVNCIPVFIAKEEMWQGKFHHAGLPIVGDDIKSQVGATIVHRALVRLFNDRGVTLDKTSQLNVGGNMDFKNMLERERLESKKISKTNSVTSQLDRKIESDCIHVGPSDFVPWLEDRKWAYLRCEGTAFGDVPLNIELKMEVWDSPNSAGIVIDALRSCKIAMDRGISGALVGPSAYFMKSPPIQFSDSKARDMVEEFIQGKDTGLISTAEMGNGKDLEDLQDAISD
ncbi:MAG: inositol-3-phosphate synthase [Candidatus Anoxymicrobium japonicum]|uniref:Inositol-3-phosphate synthase n=1 Tax=Candidatus Anoxymicrobium japonicum TaxID=2013648 RepID=A0A2N3G647_9ACTN|nr:MAG: inositol-3-phosphate synthase [Candidatus Anoxymicrobium japonicum]